MRVAQHRLQLCDAILIILSYLPEINVLRLQMLNRRFYNRQIPLCLTALTLKNSAMLTSTQFQSLRRLLGPDTRLNLLFVGSEQNFSAAKFHELCDN